jgi:hypothetical protein
MPHMGLQFTELMADRTGSGAHSFVFSDKKRPSCMQVSFHENNIVFGPSRTKTVRIFASIQN